MSKMIGPSLPSHLIESDLDEAKADNCGGDSDDDFGPALPPDYSTSDNEKEPETDGNDATEGDSDDLIGPLPNESEDNSLHRKRRSRSSNESSSVEPKVRREEWMTVVPEVLTKQFGMGPRKFDNSSRSKLPVEAEPRSSRDIEQEKISIDLASKRKESLLDIHRDKLKDADSSGASKTLAERVPFDKEKDMKTTLLDQESKKKMINNCQNFVSKFQTSNSNKFL